MQRFILAFLLMATILFGSIFDTSPAEVRGNLFNAGDKNEAAHGYFQAVNQTFHRFFIPAYLPSWLPLHCE